MSTIDIHIDTDLADPTVAASLRALADVIDPPKPEEAAPAPAPRFVLVSDRLGDFGIRDKETALIADFITRDPSKVTRVIEKLNSGERRPRDLVEDEGREWAAEDRLYPPYVEVTP